ncbi:MAG: box helicase, partial [Labilithrix sp.]|nr:box helicase [Labilithrix sp.]
PGGERREVPGTFIALRDAVVPLAQAPALAEDDASPSLVAYALACKLTLDLVARERLVPWAPEGEARWAAVLGEPEQRAVRALAAALPPAAHAAVLDGGVVASRSLARRARVHEPEALLRQMIDDAVDAVVRVAAAGAGDEVLALATAEGPWERRFAKALGTADAAFVTRGFAERNVARDLADWSRAARGARNEPRTCFRLELPQEGDDTFLVRLMLQAADDPSLVVPASVVWSGDAVRLGRAFRDPEESLLAGLGSAARLYPPLRAVLDDAAPEALRLDAEDAWSFLTEAAPRLTDAGFGVLVPGELTPGGQRRLGLRGQLGDEGAPRRRGTKIAGVVAGAAGLAMEQLVEFQWQAAIGDEPLTARELAALAKHKAPLVRFRGAWVAIDPRELAEIRRRVMEPPRQVRALEALTMLLAGAPEGTGAPVASGSIARLLEQVRSAAAAPVPVPRSLVATLRPYQERGLAWLATMASLGLGGCLADDMGLGKTVQLLAFLLHRAEVDPVDARPVLLVAPTSVVGNWEREAARFAPSLTIVRHYGGARAREAAELREGGPGRVVLTTYGLVRRDSALLAEVSWRAVVLDEAQNAKNSASATAKAVRLFRADVRFALTGTPVENRLAELWSVLDFANPGSLGPLARFKEELAVPIERFANPEASARLRRLAAPFLFRRVKTDPAVISDLPAKNEMDVFCTLTREQATLYRAVVDEQLREIAERDGVARRGAVLAMLTALKQICNHPAQYLGERGPLARRSGKLARITEMLEEALAAGDKALVFTQYREMGDRLVAHLGEALGVEVLFLHGGTSKNARDALVERFQNEPRGARIFVLSLKAGGTGLNLTAASHVFHYDRWWNPAVEDQATDRAYRIGQKRAVQVHKLACTGTVEERVAQLLVKKRALASAVVGAGEQWITELDDAGLRELVTLSGDAVVSDDEPERRSA